MSEPQKNSGLLASVDPEFLTRAYLYLEADLSPDVLQVFEQELRSVPENAEAFVQLCLIRSRLTEELSQRRHGQRDLVSLDFAAADELGMGRASMNDAMVAAAIVPADETPEASELAPLSGLLPEETPPEVAPPGAVIFRSRWYDWRVWGGIAASILLVIGLFSLRGRSSNLSQIASVSATAGARWDSEPPQLANHQPLPPGSSLKLASGYVQLAYANGSTVVLQGPCDVRLDSPLAMTLTSGRITAAVSVAGHGLTVSTPHGKVVDLGTEFGVTASSDSTEVRVFVGRVEVRPAGTARDQIVPLVAGDSAKVDDAGVSVQASAVDTTGYVLDIHQITQPLTVHSTGEGLKPGDADANWQVTSFPGDRAWRAAPAVACDVVHGYVGNNSRSTWVSYVQKMAAPVGLYTFTTTIDTTGFDPSTIHLHLGGAADDGIVEIRLNGKPTGLHVTDHSPYQFLHQLTLDDGFVAGINRLDVVVSNARLSPMGLRLELSGVGTRMVNDR